MNKSRVGFRDKKGAADEDLNLRDHPLVYSKQFQANIDARKAKSKAEKAAKSAAPKKLVSDEKMARMRRKVEILNRKEVALNKRKARQTGELAKKLTKEKAKASGGGGAKLPSRTKAVTETVLSGEGKDLPDLYKHGMGNAAKFELEAMLEKSKKDTAKEIKAMKTAGRDYFTVKKVQGGTEYHTKAASAMAEDQERIQTRLKQYVASHGIRDAGVQEMIGKFNKFAKSAVGRARKTKMEALRRLGFID